MLYQSMMIDNCAYNTANKQMADYLDDNLFETFLYQILQMLYYNKIDVNKEIDPTKCNRSKECMICHSWFFNHGFKFQNSVCNDCHDLTMLCRNVSVIAIIIVKKVDYCGIIHNMVDGKYNMESINP